MRYLPLALCVAAVTLAGCLPVRYKSLYYPTGYPGYGASSKRSASISFTKPKSTSSNATTPLWSTKVGKVTPSVGYEVTWSTDDAAAVAGIIEVENVQLIGSAMYREVLRINVDRSGTVTMLSGTPPSLVPSSVPSAAPTSLYTSSPTYSPTYTPTYVPTYTATYAPSPQGCPAPAYTSVPGTYVRVRLLNGNDEPVEDAYVSCTSLDPSMPWATTLQTDSNGEFTVEAPQGVNIEFRAEYGGATARKVTAFSSATDTLTLRLPAE